MPVFVAQTACIQAGTEAPASLTRELRRADGFIALAVQAGFAALGGQTEQPGTGRHGLVLGTAFGPMQTNFEVLDQVVHTQQTSPTLFSHSVYNAAAGYLSRIFGLRGSALTITDFAFPFFQALGQASALLSGQLESCLVLQVETYSTLLAEARSRIAGRDAALWPAGAVAWLLTRDGGGNSREITALDVRLEPAAGAGYLTLDERLTMGARSLTLADPLGAAAACTDIMAEASAGEHSLRITASYGSINLSYRSRHLPLQPEI